jgi:hypothetical protein
MLDVSHKRKVKILNPASDTGDHTSSSRALTLVMQGRAAAVDCWTIRILDPAEQAASTSAVPAVGGSAKVRHSPSPSNVVEFHGASFDGQSFLRYPHRDMATPGLARARRAELSDDAAGALTELLAA